MSDIRDIYDTVGYCGYIAYYGIQWIYYRILWDIEGYCGSVGYYKILWTLRTLWDIVDM